MENDEKDKKKEKDNITLNYDYTSYENIINNNLKTKPLNLLKTNKDYNIDLNSDVLNNINQADNDMKRNSITEISSNKNNDMNINSNYELYREFNLGKNNNENINNNIDKRYIQTTRNNVKVSSNLLKAYMIENDYRNIIKQKESLEKKLNLNDLLIDSKKNNYFNNNTNKRKKSEETKNFETLDLLLKQENINNKNSKTIFNKYHEKYLLTDEDLNIEYEELKPYTNKDKKNFKNYKSNPQLNTVIDRDLLNNSDDKKDKKSENNNLQDKSDKIYKEYFVLKTKYEISKKNINKLNKKLKQKNYDISQMKKVLISNNQQIHFLSSLKDSNQKTLKDNEDLIKNLKTTITNLNSKIIEYKNKLSFLSQNNYSIIKSENESLKIHLNDSDKTISTLKNSLLFLTQNLDSILNNSNCNENNEKIIYDCEQKIKLLKEQMNKKLYEFNIEKNPNLEIKLHNILIDNENTKNILEEKNKETEKYINKIKELTENINNKNKEIIEIKIENEKIKKNLDEKIKELEEKTIHIKELNNNIEKKNKEINDIQNILNMKNKEIEKNKKIVDLKIINQSSLEINNQNKKYELDIHNKNNQTYENNKTYSIISNDYNYYNKNNKTNNKIFIKKIKNNNNDFKTKNHLAKQLLFNKRDTNNNKFKLKANFDYFNHDNYFEKETGITMKSLYNFNYRKYKSNKNFNTIMGNNLFANQTSNTNIINDSKIAQTPTHKLRLFNDNDEDIKNTKYPNPKNKIKRSSPNLLLSTSSMSISQNENIKSIIYLEKSTSNFECIYSLTGSDIICFNFIQKKFDIISVNDNTRGIFTSYISYYKQNKLRPLLLNTQKNFFVLMQKYIFYYDFSLNNINILTKTFSNHLNGNFIQIENSLYSISGNNNTQCELYSLIINQNKLLPSTNYPRINSGICNINNEYIYLFFGQFCQNSIERLNIQNLNYDEKWEIIKINEINDVNNNIINLGKFISFLDDYDNVIIFGGEDYNNEKGNKNIFGFNLSDNSISVIGKIDSCAMYVNQYIKLDESIFSVFDENNGLHFFSKELDYHEIFNLNF